MTNKLSTHNWTEYKQFWQWCVSYAPKLLMTFYNPLLSEQEFTENRERFIDEQLERYQGYEIRRIGGRKVTLKEATENLLNWYDSKFKFPMYSYPEAEQEAESILTYMKYSEDDWRQYYKITICKLPSKYIFLLLWTCPLVFIREYLYKQCGFNPKWEKLYQFFFRGKHY